MTASTTYDDTNLKATDLKTILQAIDIPSTVIDIIIEEYDDWYGLINDDTDSQFRTLKEKKIQHKYCCKVKFVRYKVLYDNLNMCDIANYNLQPGEVTNYVHHIDEELRTGAKVLPLSVSFLGLASKSSPHKTTLPQQEQFSNAINLLVENQADLLKMKVSPHSPSEDDTFIVNAFVPEYDFSSFDNDDETVHTKPFDLIPLTDKDFTYSDVFLDDSYDSSSTILCDDLDQDYHDPRPPPEPPP